jgi:hypothetical protein
MRAISTWQGRSSCGEIVLCRLKFLEILVHGRRAIGAFAPVEFGKANGNFFAGFFEPDLLFAVEAGEELKGNLEDFLGVGVAAGGELGLDKLFLFGGEGEHGWGCEYDDDAIVADRQWLGKTEGMLDFRLGILDWGGLVG